MCFSATASFTAGAVLSVTGAATLHKASTPPQKVLASIPIIFAVQQITEGIMWISLTNPVHTQWILPSAYIFLAFAHFLWPFWVPMAMLMMETNTERRKKMRVLLLCGLAVSAYLGSRLLTQTPVAEIRGAHIFYGFGVSLEATRVCGVLYFIATIFPPFFSSIRRMWFLGASNFVSFVVSWFFFQDYIVSMWCFFAAFTSIAIYFILARLQHPVTVNKWAARRHDHELRIPQP